MKPYIHNPQVYRNHFGSGDTVFQGARRQRGYGAVKRFAVPLISKGIKFAAPFVKKVARQAVRRVAPNSQWAQQLSDMAIDKLTQKLSSKPMIEQVVGISEKKAKNLFKKRKRPISTSRPAKRKKDNVFY